MAAANPGLPPFRLPPEFVRDTAVFFMEGGWRWVALRPGERLEALHREPAHPNDQPPEPLAVIEMITGRFGAGSFAGTDYRRQPRCQLLLGGQRILVMVLPARRPARFSLAAWTADHQRVFDEALLVRGSRQEDQALFWRLLPGTFGTP